MDAFDSLHLTAVAGAGFALLPVSQVDKPPSYNPVVLTFREYARIIADMGKPGPLAQRLKHLWGPPEWVRPTVSWAAGTARKREGPADAGSISYGVLNPADRRGASP